MRIQEILGTELTAFVSDCFETTVVHFAEGSAHRFHSLLSLQDVLQAYEWANPNQVQILRNGVRGYSFEKEKDLVGAYKSGYSIIVNDVHEQLPSLRTIIHSLSAELSVGAEANLYLTPPDENGLASHVDSHDGLILQVSGKKRWFTWNQSIDLPFWSFRTQPSAEPSAIYTLNAGHALYLPRGVPHELKTEEDHSLHLTISLKGILGFEVINEANKMMAKRDLMLRRSTGDSLSHDLIAAMPLQYTQDKFVAAFETLKKIQICELPKLHGFGRSAKDVRVDTRLFVTHGYPMLYQNNELAVPGLGSSRGQANVLRFDASTAEIINTVLAMEQTFMLSQIQNESINEVLAVCRDLYSLGILNIDQI